MPRTVGMMLLAGFARAGYVHRKDYMDGDFFTKWEFMNGNDPTHGFVDYVDSETAWSENLVKVTENGVWMGVDNTSEVPAGHRGRKSVRLESVERYNGGLFVISMDHAPTGCGTWPAFWMFGDDTEHTWPQWGEYDIMEWIHDETKVSTTLHTTGGCEQDHLVPGEHMLAEWNPGMNGNTAADNCDVNAHDQWSNQGCSQRGLEGSVGSSFNSQGGGTYAAEWDPVSEHIRTWFWPAGQEPSDLKAKTPDPSSWGTPFSYFSLHPDKCHSNHFKNMRLVFDLTFCGDLAGATFGDHCSAHAQSYGSCEDFVSSNPQAFNEAFWSVTALDVYHREAPAVALVAAETRQAVLERRVQELEAILRQKDRELRELWSRLQEARGKPGQAALAQAGSGAYKATHQDLPPGHGQGGTGQADSRRRRRSPGVGPTALKY